VSLSPTAETSDQGLRIRPSPFSVERDGATRIQYRLAEAPSLVRVRIFDARGRKVRTLEDTRLVGRTGSLVWDGRDDAGDRVRVGVYVILFEAIRAEAGTIARFKEPVVVARPLN
jgi:flagellar hook assembly protein FlgD